MYIYIHMYAHVYVHMCMYNTYIPHPNSYHGVTNCNAQFAPLPTHASTRPGQDDGSGTWSHFNPPAAAAPLGAGPRPRCLTNVGCARNFCNPCVAARVSTETTVCRCSKEGGNVTDFFYFPRCLLFHIWEKYQYYYVYS